MLTWNSYLTRHPVVLFQQPCVVDVVWFKVIPAAVDESSYLGSSPLRRKNKNPLYIVAPFPKPWLANVIWGVSILDTWTASLTLSWEGQARTGLTSLMLTFHFLELRCMTPLTLEMQSILWPQKSGSKSSYCLAVSAAMLKMVQKMRTVLTEDHYTVYTHWRKQKPHYCEF